jgi:hypothetical protein
VLPYDEIRQKSFGERVATVELRVDDGVGATRDSPRPREVERAGIGRINGAIIRQTIVTF